MDWYLAVWKKYADFSGRARRKEYWLFGLFNALVWIVLCLIIGLFGGFNANNGPSAAVVFVYALLVLYYLAVIVPSWAVTVRRLHDIGKSAWWILISFVPAVGGIWFLILMCIDSAPGANQWGPNPKDVPAVATPATA